MATHGLAVSASRTWPPEAPLDAEVWRRLLARCKAERLTGLLAAAIAEDSFPANEGQAEQAAVAHVEQMAVCLRLERLLLEVVATFSGAGIDHRVLKGPAVARLDYNDTSLRPYTDIDLLVPSGAFDGAAHALEQAGLRRHFAQARRGFDRRFGKGATFETGGGLTVDLHRTFVFGPFGLTVDLSDVWARWSPFTLGNLTLHALDPEVRFLHSCLHAVLGDVPPHLLALRDVAQMATGRDVDRLRELTARWRVGVVVQRAAQLVEEHMAADPNESGLGWVAQLTTTPWERRMLNVCISPSASYATKTIASLPVLPGVSAKAAYLRAMAFPDPTYLGSRHAGHLRRWQAAGRELLLVLRGHSGR